jgi:hypothetical protein
MCAMIISSICFHSSRSRIDNLSPQQLGLVLQGLGPFSSKWSVVRQAITLITERMKTLSDNGETFSAPHARGTLFALRGFRSDCMEVHGLLNSLSDMLNVSFPSSSTRRLGNIILLIYSLRNLKHFRSATHSIAWTLRLIRILLLLE